MFKAGASGQAASIEFLTTLLRGFEAWRDANSDFQSAYLSLRSQGVTFPPPEAQVRPAEPPSALTLCRSLRAVLDMNTPDAAVAERLAAELVPALDTLSVRIQTNLNSPDLPDYIAELEEIQNALDAFRRFSDSKRLVKPKGQEIPKTKTDAELLMMASFNWARIEEPIPLPLPSSDELLLEGSSGPLLDITEKQVPEVSTLKQLEDMVLIRQIEGLKAGEWMQRAEEFRLENEVLKKEIALLQQKLAELQTNKDPASAETTRFKHRSPLQSSCTTLSPGHNIDLLGFDSPMRSTLTLKPTTSPSSPCNLLKEEAVEVVNDSWFAESCQWSSGLLYKNEDLEVLAKVETERLRARVKLCFRNVSCSFLKDLCLTPVSHDETVVREEMQELPPSLLPPAANYCCELEIRPQRPYRSPPVLAISYNRLSTKVKMGLKLPVPVSKFISPISSPFAEVRNQLIELKQWEESMSFEGLKEGITNMKTLARVFCLHNSLSLYFPSETGLERGIVAFGSGFGVMVGAQVQLDTTASNVSVKAWSSDAVLRNQLLLLLVSQIRH